MIKKGIQATKNFVCFIALLLFSFSVLCCGHIGESTEVSAVFHFPPTHLWGRWLQQGCWQGATHKSDTRYFTIKTFGKSLIARVNVVTHGWKFCVNAVTNRTSLPLSVYICPKVLPCNGRIPNVYTLSLYIIIKISLLDFMLMNGRHHHHLDRAVCSLRAWCGRSKEQFNTLHFIWRLLQ